MGPTLDYMLDVEPTLKKKKRTKVLKFNSENTNNLIEKWAKDVNRHFTKKDL